MGGPESSVVTVTSLKQLSGYKAKMAVLKVMVASDSTSTVCHTLPSTGHELTATLTWLYAACSCSNLAISSSNSPPSETGLSMVSISSARVSRTRSSAMKKKMKLPPSVAADSISSTPAMFSHVAPSRVIAPPDSTVMPMGMTTGRVPSWQGMAGMPSTPASTLVGQSGPPTSRNTLCSVTPGASMINLIPLVTLVLTPRAERTQRAVPKYSPKTFCSTKKAACLQACATTTAQHMHSPKLHPSFRPALAMITPDARYAGTPGTTGMAKRPCAMRKIAAETVQTEAPDSTLLSHAMKSVTQCVTPTMQMKYAKPSRMALVITDVQSHCPSSAMRWMALAVNMRFSSSTFILRPVSGFDLSLRTMLRRTSWLKKERRRKVRKIGAPSSTIAPFTQSLCRNATSMA
mmetsp:Transcript_42653/g.100215  ORF Transcript_42653/g.100215 Transcript_42653/m.100215 type:complete len:404 (-) Transcript_42653:1635-2846(-)